MMSLRLAAVAATAVLIAIAIAGAAPADAASATSLTSKSVWATMDRCTKTARQKYPDETAESLSKRDAYVQACQREGRVPVREGQAPKQ